LIHEFRCEPVVRRQCDITREANARARNARVCVQCGTSFQQGSLSKRQIDAGHVQRFCSRECLSASLRKPVQPRTCSDCGVEVGSRKRKCTKCIKPAYAPVSRIVSPCTECGQPIIGTRAKRICAPCLKAHTRRVNKHRKRARWYGVGYEPVDPIKVFERDQWRCQLCGCKTPRQLRGSLQDNAPELDHITPMSVCGEHSYRNTQCACRKCNMTKGSKPLGQLRLLA
jgi:hypothetical protein